MINHLLLKAGLLVKPLCRVQAELTVKNTTQHSQTAALIKEGKVVDVDTKSSKMVTSANDARETIQPALTTIESSGSLAPSESRNNLKILDVSNHLIGPPNEGFKSPILAQEEDQQYDLLLWSRMFQVSHKLMNTFKCFFF